MNKLFVYAGFDFLDKEEIIGTLTHERVRGNDSYCFEYNEEWLNNHCDIILSRDIENYKGKQYLQSGNIFGCFADTLPDRWGRTLFKRKEEILSKKENRLPRKLTDWDYLININDHLRMGGLRYKIDRESDYINTERDKLSIPPISNIRELLRASLNEEQLQLDKDSCEDRWIKQLIIPGTSLGGARPKAVIEGEQGELYIAKFPSINDDYDFAKWEHFTSLLSKEIGIDTAKTRSLDLGGKHSTLLSRRFDRTEDGKSIHFASAMTLLGLKDGDNSMSGYGYTDIVDFIISNSCEPTRDLEELYRRVAFNICIGNVDDHFRNHGFVLSPKGWKLSPAYDVNPTPYDRHSLMISRDSNESNLSLLLNSYEDYFLDKSKAQEIIKAVIDKLSYWEQVSAKFDFSEAEKQQFRLRIESVTKPYLSNQSNTVKRVRKMKV